MNLYPKFYRCHQRPRLDWEEQIPELKTNVHPAEIKFCGQRASVGNGASLKVSRVSRRGSMTGCPFPKLSRASKSLNS